MRKLINNSTSKKLFEKNIDTIISVYSDFEKLTHNEHANFTFCSRIIHFDINHIPYGLRCVIHLLRKNKKYYLVAKVLFSIRGLEKSTEKVKSILKSNKALNFEQEFENVEDLHFCNILKHFKTEGKEKIIYDFIDEVQECLQKTKNALEKKHDKKSKNN